jgi:hypothetical protein
MTIKLLFMSILLMSVLGTGFTLPNSATTASATLGSFDLPDIDIPEIPGSGSDDDEENPPEDDEEQPPDEEEPTNDDDEEDPPDEEIPPEEECGPDEVKDDESGECIPADTDDDGCPEEGQSKNDDGECVDVPVPHDPTLCNDDEEKNEAGVCVPKEPTDENCESGHYWDGNTCVPNDHCLDNEKWDDKKHECIHEGCEDGWYWDGDHCREPPKCDPPYKWNHKEQKCKLKYETDYDIDINRNYNTKNNIDSCQKSFIVAVNDLRLPGCLVSSNNGIGTINFLERNFNNIIVGNNQLPNVLLTFVRGELGTTSSGQSVMNELSSIANQDGNSLNGIDNIQFAFNVNWNPQPDTSKNTFTYCSGENCETHIYSATF